MLVHAVGKALFRSVNLASEGVGFQSDGMDRDALAELWNSG